MIDEKEIERSQRRLASLLQFDPAAKVCAACGELIFPDETVRCRGVPNCEARLK